MNHFLSRQQRVCTEPRGAETFFAKKIPRTLLCMEIETTILPARTRYPNYWTTAPPLFYNVECKRSFSICIWNINVDIFIRILIGVRITMT